MKAYDKCPDALKEKKVVVTYETFVSNLTLGTVFGDAPGEGALLYIRTCWGAVSLESGIGTSLSLFSDRKNTHVVYPNAYIVKGEAK